MRPHCVNLWGELNEVTRMTFAKAPITISYEDKSAFLYSQKGIFMIDSVHMVNLLKYIENRSYVHEEQITELWNKVGDSSIDISEVINYLTDDVQVLLELEPGFKLKEVYYVDNHALSSAVKHRLFIEKNIIPQQEFVRGDIINSEAIYVVDMLNYNDCEKIELIQNKLSSESIVIFLFVVGDCFVISHSYSKTNLIPCALCLYDYMMENVFSDRKNKISSLSEVIDYINSSHKIKAPGAFISELDYFYMLRELEQYLLTLTGNGRGAFTGCDINSAKIININTLEKKDLVIPFSPKCNCMHLYHQNEGYVNA